MTFTSSNMASFMASPYRLRAMLCFFAIHLKNLLLRVMSWVSLGSIECDRWNSRYMVHNCLVETGAVIDIENMQSVCRYCGNLLNTITCSSCVPCVANSMSNNSRLIHQRSFELNWRMLHFKRERASFVLYTPSILTSSTNNQFRFQEPPWNLL